MTTIPTTDLDTTEAYGTVKVGRWTYPATQMLGVVLRNAKRDGSGEWVETDAEFVVNPEDPAVRDERLAASGVFAEAEAADAEAADFDTAVTAAADAAAALAAIPGFTDETPANPDYDDLRVAYLAIFDDFAVHGWDDLTEIVGGDVARTKAVAYALRDSGLIVIEPNYKTDIGTGTLFQCYRTYDELTREQAVELFVAAFNPTATLKVRSTHGGKVGAQTKKPGRSSWTVGSACPQGHALEEGDIYVMGSGRKQCRKCRQGYPSNATA